MQTTFETTIGVRWGLLGRITSSIRREAIRLNLVLQPFPFAKFTSMHIVPVKVTGLSHNIEQFRKFMSELENRYANKN